MNKVLSKADFFKVFYYLFLVAQGKKLSHITQQVLTIDFFALENSQQIVNIDCTSVNFFFRRSNKAFIIGIIGIHVEGYIYIALMGKRTRTNINQTDRKSTT